MKATVADLICFWAFFSDMIVKIDLTLCEQKVWRDVARLWKRVNMCLFYLFICSTASGLLIFCCAGNYALCLEEKSKIRKNKYWLLPEFYLKYELFDAADSVPKTKLCITPEKKFRCEKGKGRRIKLNKRDTNCVMTQKTLGTWVPSSPLYATCKHPYWEPSSHIVIQASLHAPVRGRVLRRAFFHMGRMKLRLMVCVID